MLIKNLKVLFLFLVLLPVISWANDQAIGIIIIPEPQKINARQSGSPMIIIGKEGDALSTYPEERSSRELIKIDIFSDPSPQRKKLTTVTTAGIMHELVTSSSAGTYKFKSLKETNKYQIGQFHLLVFDKQSQWVKVKFRNQPPWNGRAGWIKLSNLTGGYIDIK